MAVALLVAVGVPVALAQLADDAAGPPEVRLGTTGHDVRYEITGDGSVPLITYTVGEQNAVEQVTNARLPWSVSISLPVGPAGGVAQVDAKSPQNGGSPITCRVHVDGKLVQEQTAADGYTGPACASPIRPEYVG